MLRVIRIGPAEWHAISSAAGGRECSTEKEIITGEVGQIKSRSKTRRGGRDVDKNDKLSATDQDQHHHW